MSKHKELPYDPKSPWSIEAYGKELIGKTFEDVISNYDDTSIAETSSYYGRFSRKGGLGNLLEELYFYYDVNSNPEADFEEAGVELKVTPIEYTQKGKLRAGERLVLTMISYDVITTFDFYKSHVWEKCRLMLLIMYLRDRKLPNRLKYEISYVSLFTPPEDDLEVIKDDYTSIMQKISRGEAHLLSESDTMYLGACTKGATAAKSMVTQFYNPEIKAKARAFCFKTSYMTYVVNSYIVKSDRGSAEKIIKNKAELENVSFQDVIQNKINMYIGMSERQLCKIFDETYTGGKAQWITLAYRMLGIKSNRAEEFMKANIVVKAIRIEENGIMRESSPMPAFEYKELINQCWEDSDLYNYLEETQFLFVIFKRQGEDYYLRGAKLWHMSEPDIDIAEKCWEKVRQIIKDGVELTFKQTAKGVVIENNFPKKSDNPIIHIRPHASKRFYKLEDGTVIGNGTYSDASQLPDGRWIPKHSFWLNNNYIVEQLKDYL